MTIQNDNNAQEAKEWQLASRRLDALLELLDGCKWSDIAALGWYRPEDEKYATRASLLAALDAAIIDRSVNMGHSTMS